MIAEPQDVRHAVGAVEPILEAVVKRTLMRPDPICASRRCAPLVQKTILVVDPPEEFAGDIGDETLACSQIQTDLVSDRMLELYAVFIFGPSELLLQAQAIMKRDGPHPVAYYGIEEISVPRVDDGSLLALPWFNIEAETALDPEVTVYSIADGQLGSDQLHVRCILVEADVLIKIKAKLSRHVVLNARLHPELEVGVGHNDTWPEKKKNHYADYN